MYFYTRVTGMKYNCSVSVSHFRDVFFQMLQFYTECITLCWQSLSLISEASLKKHLRKTVSFFLEGITWCIPQTPVHPGILAHSWRSCKKCLRSRRCRKPVTFLASDLFTTWQTGPECGVSAADLCVKRSWKLVNNGYEVEVPTPDLYHMQQLAMLMRKVFPARGFLRCQVIVHCTSTVIIFGKEQKQLHRIIFPTVASHSSLEGKQTGQETPFWTCKEDGELIFISVNMSSLHIPVLFI